MPIRMPRAADTKIAGYRSGYPVKVGERGWQGLEAAFDAAAAAPGVGDGAVRPNLGIKDAYKRAIQRLIREMATSYEYWLKAAYRADPPRMAQDATPAAELQKALNDLGKQWEKRIDAAAPKLAKWFALSVNKRSQKALMQILRDGGITVDFKMTPAMRDVFQATVQENVSLIKSIGSQYHTQVEGIVMRSVQSGRDLGYMYRELRKRYPISAKRAALISLDQNNKATSALMKARNLELGLQEGIWLHSHAGKEPRPTHLANHGKKFSIKDGWYDPDPRVRRRIMPGELINCRCTWRVVVPGFS